MSALLTIFCGIVAFIVGGIPFGYLLAKSKGVDIRTQGSGNIGATNVKRTLGKKLGALTLVADVLKGAACPALLIILLGKEQIAIAALLGFFSIVGHCYSPFLGGKGGKGVATSLGVFLIIAPIAAFVPILVFIATLKKSKYVALASILGSYSMVISTYLTVNKDKLLVTLIGLLIAILITLRHKENIVRMKEGSEPQAFT